MFNLGFWENLKKPIIGLSPMDGITDAAFRAIVDEIAHPGVLFTEFIPAEGLVRKPEAFQNTLIKHQTNTPVVAQIFGSNPTAFYKAVYILADCGFAGIDLNMGCPAKSIEKRGGGAALIKKPDLAVTLVRTALKASVDWGEERKKTALPISVKTRIGYDKIVTEDWLQILLSTKPAAISLHGRTLKQLYNGTNNWEEIGKAAKLVKKTKTLFLGNGNIQSLADAKEKIAKYNLDGVLIGRATLGNPWMLIDKIATPTEKLKTALLQAEKFMELTPAANFLNLRKHLAWYCNGFPNAARYREQLMHTKNLNEVKKIINSII